MYVDYGCSRKTRNGKMLKMISIERIQILGLSVVIFEKVADCETIITNTEDAISGRVENV